MKKQLIKLNHTTPFKPQHSPYIVPLKVYGRGAQEPIPDNTSKINKQQVNIMIQQVVGGVLYYTKAADSTGLISPSTIASEQTTSTNTTEANVQQLLNNLATKPAVVIQFYAP